jgi:hypothetical protein
MNDDNVISIRPAQPAEVRKARKRRIKSAPSIDDMEQAINGLHLVKDWAIFQAQRENTADEKSVCAVMDLLYRARDVLNGAIEVAPAPGRNS